MSRPVKQVTEAQRAQWAEESRAKVERAKEMLVLGLRRLETDEGWQAMLAAMARRGKLSPGRLSFRNQLLLAMQAEPGLEAVATFQAWKKLGRCVRKGERGLTILQPSPYKREVENKAGEKEERTFAAFRALAVFDIRQTDGEPLAEQPAALRFTDCEGVEGFADTVERLTKVALDLGLASAITLREREPEDHPSANGWFEINTGRITVITTGRTHAAVLCTLCHELGHAQLHGVGTDHHELPEMEVEAESVAFVVCTALGLDTGDQCFKYNAIWCGRSSGDKDAARMVMHCGERIAKASRTILDALAGEQHDNQEADAVEESSAIEATVAA